MNAVILITAFIFFELGLFVLVGSLRKRFQWLITKSDELPSFDSAALQRFIDYSFDSHLGWVRRPNSSGVESGRNGTFVFHIDSMGSRTNPLGQPPPAIAVFGDSYAFGRQVEDSETWCAQLSQREGLGVLNFGVGNYGVDQALLRYESMVLPDTVRIVIMAFVPETICRIQSYWKHYLEFGNIFGFKPRFVLDGQGRLVLLRNAMECGTDFVNFSTKLPKIRASDRFYEEKFRSFQFRFPFTLSLMRHPFKHTALIFFLIVRELSRIFHISTARIDNIPFTLVMKSNIRDAYRLYNDRNSTELLNAILLRLQASTQTRGHIPLIVVIPQLLDLRLNNRKRIFCKNFFIQLANHFAILDLTERFSNANFEKLYIDDQYGGHLSVEGNQLVSREISTWLRSNFELSQ